MSGVAFTPPPAALVPDLRASLDQALSTLPPGAKGALVLVGSRTGGTTLVNAAVLAKLGDEWAVQAYVAKRWGDTVDLAYGAMVVKTW